MIEYKIGTRVRMLPSELDEESLTDNDKKLLEKGIIVDIRDSKRQPYIILLRDGNQYVAGLEAFIIFEEDQKKYSIRAKLYEYLKDREILKEYLDCFDKTLLLGDFYENVSVVSWISKIDTSTSKMNWQEINAGWHRLLVKILREDWGEAALSTNPPEYLKVKPGDLVKLNDDVMIAIAISHRSSNPPTTPMFAHFNENGELITYLCFSPSKDDCSMYSGLIRRDLIKKLNKNVFSDNLLKGILGEEEDD